MISIHKYFLEETVFWTEEVESEIIRWNDEKDKLAEVNFKCKYKFET